MNNLTYQWEPLAVPPKPRNRQRSKFKATWSQTLALLERELGHLNAKAVAIQADIKREDLRLDGILRAGVKPRSPAVALSFNSKFGQLTYPCDTYDDWQDNIRAIALALKALRTVDRYGVTRKGEQYTGWAKLPGPNGHSFNGREDAMEFLRRIIGGRVDVLPRESALREAEMATHPDRGGEADDFKRVQEARKILLG